MGIDMYLCELSFMDVVLLPNILVLNGFLLEGTQIVKGHRRLSWRLCIFHILVESVK